MKIMQILSQHRNDFTADMECEHCGNVQRNPYGYHDAYYHEKVIPAMTCKKCRMNRAGEIPENSNDDGLRHVGN